ncbi:MAG: hypothetical protein U9R58_08895, partial [Chloroflexota bacterium]|nr:hypothetical protein [Chloroflexota bacterium]
GDLSVTTGAALVGTYGMQAVIDDNNAIYVTDDTPNGETEYVARFYFDPNSISMAEGDNHTIFYGYKDAISPVVRVELRYSSGNYQIRVQVRKDFLFANTSYYTISDGEHYIEIDWKASTSPGANDGELTLWIDGVQKEQLTNIDNDSLFIDQARLGAVAEIDSGTRGTYYFDAFESRSDGYIGPVAAMPGFPVAQASPVEGMLAYVSYWILSLLQHIWEKITALIHPTGALASNAQESISASVAMTMSQAVIPEGQVWKTYYYAGSQRVAMRVQDGVTDEVYYLLSDHLGSTTVTTDSDGDFYGEIRYSAWGTVRYSSGHEGVCVGAICSDDEPEQYRSSEQYELFYWKTMVRKRYGITLSDSGDKPWGLVNARLIYYSLGCYDRMMRGQFKSFVGGGSWTMMDYDKDSGEYYGETDGKTNVQFFTKGSDAIRQMNIFHETGHVINSLPCMDNVFSGALTASNDRSFIDENGYIDTKALIENRVNDPNHFPGPWAIQASEAGDLEAIADVLGNYAAGNIDMDTVTGRAMNNFVTEILAIYIWHSAGSRTYK